MIKFKSVLSVAILLGIFGTMVVLTYNDVEDDKEYATVDRNFEITDERTPLIFLNDYSDERYDLENVIEYDNAQFEQFSIKGDVTSDPIDRPRIKEESVVIPIEICGELHFSNESELYFNDKVIENFEGFIESLRLFTELTKVEMCNTNLSNEHMEILCELFPTVKFVWVVHCAGFSTRTDAVAFSTMFTGYGWAPETEVDFEVLKYCKDLEALDIGHHSIKNLDFLRELKNMKILILAINKIEDISVLEDMTQITYLELFLNKITDLSPLEKLVNIEHLNICHNKNLGEIEPILHYPNLQRLWISYCNLTPEEKGRIKVAYPNARLEFDVYESVQAGWRSTEVYRRMRNVFNTNTMDEMFLPKIWPIEREIDLQKP